MAIGIYKSGQGYWVRVLTACFLGMIVLAGAAWLWTQMQLVNESLPKTTFDVTVDAVSGAVAPGEQVTLLVPDTNTAGAFVPSGTARVETFDSVNNRLRLSGVERPDTPDAIDLAGVARVQSAGALPPAPDAPPPASTFSAAVSSRVVPIPSIEPLYLQGGVAALAIILGSILVYYFVAVKPATVDFLIATDMEMRKVNWSTRKDIIASTWVVIGAAFLIAAGLFVVDLGFKTLFQSIGILVR